MKAIKKIISPVKITQVQDKAIKGRIEVKITLKKWQNWYLYITTIINYIFYGSKILNSTKQGDKYVSESFEMTSDNAGLQVTTKDDSDVLVEISLDGATW